MNNLEMTFFIVEYFDFLYELQIREDGIYYKHNKLTKEYNKIMFNDILQIYEDKSKKKKFGSKIQGGTRGFTLIIARYDVIVIKTFSRQTFILSTKEGFTFMELVNDIREIQ